MDHGIRELEAAAQALLASPQSVTSEQRHSAEETFMNFRKLKNPFNLCRHILDCSSCDLVLFEAAALLKDALIREWSLVPAEEIKNLRTYLLNYVVEKKTLSAYVRERILQVVAIMVKRGSVDDLGFDRGHILSEVEKLILSGDSNLQLVGCSVVTSLLQEYASTVKSSDVGLRWEVHFKAKRQFEMTDLRKIFEFTMQALGSIFGSVSEIGTRESCLLLSRLLAIAESILSWSFVPQTMLPKRLVGVFEADQNPSLRPGPQWSETILNPDLVDLILRLHWKVRNLPDLCHHTLNCLIQLASLNGVVVANKEIRVAYLSNYLTKLLGFLTVVELSGQEALGISSLFRKLVLFFPVDTLEALDRDLQQAFFSIFVRLTCLFAERAAREETSKLEDPIHMEAFDNLLMGWDSISSECTGLSDDLRIQVFDTYLKCRLAPPDGLRGKGAEDEPEEEIEETEEDDRTRYKDQLSSVGVFGQVVCGHSLNLTSRLLEDRITGLSVQLQRMHGQNMNLGDHHLLGVLFEDLHWLLLISGHILSMDCDGETTLIPQDILKLSIRQAPTVNVEASIAVLASAGNRASSNSGVEESCDYLVRVVAAVLRLCEVERRAADAGLAHLLSPELGITIAWWLKRFARTYLIPNESLYSELSPVFIAAFGRDSEGASWLVSFLLNKVESNLRTQNSEPGLINETLDLFMALVESREKRKVVTGSGPFWSVLRLHNSLELSQMSGAARRKYFRVLTKAAADAVNSPMGVGDQNYYWNNVLKPLVERLVACVKAEDFNRTVHQDEVRGAIATCLESLIGVVQGCEAHTVRMLFAAIHPVLELLPRLIHVAHNYSLVIELTLEFMSTCARQMLVFLGQAESRTLYQSCLESIQAYASHASGIVSREASAEEDAHRDLLLLMELLMNLLSKDFIDLSSAGFEEVQVSASEVCWHGLHLLMPLMNANLLRFPALCTQYFKLITFACEICPEKMVALPESLLSNLFTSLQLGLTTFGADAATLSFDFINVLASHLVKSKLQGTPVHQMMQPFLKIVLEMLLMQQVNTELLTSASGALYALVCAYQTEYQQLVNVLLSSQDDENCSARLVNAFNSLTRDVVLNAERQGRMKFRDNFDSFIMEVRGLLVVK